MTSCECGSQTSTAVTLSNTSLLVSVRVCVFSTVGITRVNYAQVAQSAAKKLVHVQYTVYVMVRAYLLLLCQ